MDKFICVGKNYLEHAQELGDTIPEKPVLFLKPPSAGIFVNHPNDHLRVLLPVGRGSIHHECEVLLKLNAQRKIQAVTLGLDLTLRDVQAGLKKNGHPWEISKTFLGSAIVGPWVPVSEFPSYLSEGFTFSLDGQVRQRGQALQMTLSPEECIHYAAEFFPLCDGDVIFTGTPAGVGPLKPGQTAEFQWGDILRYKLSFE